MRYMLLLLIGVSLSGCAETGRLLGAITVFPLKVITGSAGYDEADKDTTSEILNTNDAIPINMGK